MANRYGTMSRVVGVPNRSPPITARASAAFCSSPGPPIAIGNMPTIIAAAVISTGRMRVCPASRAARNALRRAGDEQHRDDAAQGCRQRQDYYEGVAEILIVEDHEQIDEYGRK